ncbi:type II toxin-antitoxin system RelE/ParE family toxin [Allorhizobium sp. NPDC080224]|jgi:plasmid stabilization system protein ParE|uniref:Type II toxin-antitoxin system RelE/ParE family toxin n=1 Tax=Rhizobium rosettiformans TaxID=1368430 RepID=A0ABX7EY52_9HYPH|nr:type II toxin-antitoxin system RelE/ParE family toxin [Rhizobium rosettiformans]QRF52351.1 type II toxin-antitoxin system RelE/ParE family toxin [Rhizobium rosettiformans]
MKTIRLSHKAADYIRQESAYLKDRSPAAARTFALAMKRARSLLQDFPEAGNTLHGLQIAGFRTLVVDNYLIDYRADDETVDIVTIRHGRMQQPMPDIDDADTSDDM